MEHAVDQGVDRLKLKKNILLVIIWIPLLAMYIFGKKMVQDQGYHTFADEKFLLGVNNFHNVISNIPFTIVSLLGFMDYYKNKSNYTVSWLVFLIGVFLVAPGSAYYHIGTSNATLVWDRLPMTIGFMGLTSVVISEVFALKNELKLLIPLILLGIYSVVHWVIFEDLRVYAWVQITPILGLLYISLLIPTQSLKAKHLFIAVAFYVAAKLTEKYDYQIYDALGYSGHSIKHILASFAVFTLILMKRPKADLN